MYQKKKIVHIHSDSKFLSEIYKYSNKFFDNQLVFLGDKNSVPKKFDDILISFPLKEKEKFKQILKTCEEADIIIINNLENFSVNLILKLNDKIRIIWRFFGNEIYPKEKELIYSCASLKTWKPPVSKLSPVNQLKFYVWRLFNPKDRFKLALKRINYFMGLMDDEYSYLKSIGYHLPPFIQLPIGPFELINSKNNIFNLIIFGNSRNRANNHLDILNLFKTIELNVNLVIKMFFSYGSLGEYSKEVKQEAKNIKQIDLIEDFLSKDEFENLYTQASALIFNGYRQMAMGNIFIALSNGVKVYLSEKNITYKWFLKNNIKVFSIEKELRKDLINNTYFLTTEEIEINTNGLSELFRMHNKEKFNQQLLEVSTRY